MRHIQAQHLWLQEKVHSKEMEVCKVDGKRNIADILTKAIEEETLLKHMAAMDMEYRKGRAKAAPKVASNSSRSAGW